MATVEMIDGKKIVDRCFAKIMVGGQLKEARTIHEVILEDGSLTYVCIKDPSTCQEVFDDPGKVLGHQRSVHSRKVQARREKKKRSIAAKQGWKNRKTNAPQSGGTVIDVSGKVEDPPKLDQTPIERLNNLVVEIGILFSQVENAVDALIDSQMESDELNELRQKAAKYDRIMEAAK